MRRLGCLSLLATALGCFERGDPPLSETAERAELELVVEHSAAPPRTSAREVARGSIEDALPFVPSGEKAASIAWRSWIYTDVGPRRTRYGYLRAGSLVDVRGPAIENDGCQGGWYRVNPRGFLCLGLGATLDLSHPVVVASARRPTRGQALPYAYALSNETPPLLYFRLPSLREMRESEGAEVAVRAANQKERMRVSGLDRDFPLGPPPEFLGGGARLQKPHGVKQPLRYAYHTGAASAESGFAFASTFEWEGRPFGLTTELDLVALDRTKLVRPSPFHGIALAFGEDLPVGFSMPPGAQRYERKSSGQMLPSATLGHREAVRLTGNEAPGAVVEASDGSWIPKAILRLVPKRTSFPSFATGDRKWLDVSVRDQTLVAYVGRRPVYVTLVSTGRSGLADPEETDATVRGSFMIHQKEVSSTMDGAEDRADSFELRDVPFVQYFHKGYALHGTYWHDDFGKPRSHGCVNLSPIDAAWLFEWTDPTVPPDWHGVLNKERGTVVLVRR